MLVYVFGLPLSDELIGSRFNPNHSDVLVLVGFSLEIKFVFCYCMKTETEAIN